VTPSSSISPFPSPDSTQRSVSLSTSSRLVPAAAAGWRTPIRLPALGVWRAPAASPRHTTAPRIPRRAPAPMGPAAAAGPCGVASGPARCDGRRNEQGAARAKRTREGDVVCRRNLTAMGRISKRDLWCLTSRRAVLSPPFWLLAWHFSLVRAARAHGAPTGSR
jgi:hypothetical protein